MRHICTHAAWHFMTYDVTTVNGVTTYVQCISPEVHVSLFFSLQCKCKFLFACLLRSLRSDWEEVKCKSNMFLVLVFESIPVHCWIKKKLAFCICTSCGISVMLVLKKNVKNTEYICILHINPFTPKGSRFDEQNRLALDRVKSISHYWVLKG